MKRTRLPSYRRLSLLLLAVLLVAGMLCGALPAAAADTVDAPYQATFYADDVLVATVPFDPDTGISAEIEVPRKEGYTGRWESYTLTASDIRINAVYTPIAGYQAPMSDRDVINCLIVLILVLLAALLLLLLLTLRARKILKAHGLWGKDAKEMPPKTEKHKKDTAKQPAPVKVEQAAPAYAEEEEQDTQTIEQAAPADNLPPEQETISEENEQEKGSTPGKKSEASVEDEAEHIEADARPAPAEASKQQATADDTPSASTEKTATNDPQPVSQAENAPTQVKQARDFASAMTAVSAGGREDEMSTVLVCKDGRRVQIKCRQSFRARIIQAEPECKGYYNDLKNYMLSYDGVQAADSLNYESFGSGRRPLAKMNITGKTIMLFLALDPERLEGSKYKYENVGDRTRYEKTPVKIKIRSARSYKWAKELIEMTMAENGRPFVAEQHEQHVPAERSTREELIRMGLIQVDARDMTTGEKIDEKTVVRLIEEGAVPEGSPAPVAAEEQQTVPTEAEAAAAIAVVTEENDVPPADDTDEDAAEDVGSDFTIADMRMMANVDLDPDEDSVLELLPHLDKVSAEQADELVTDAVAEHHIEHHHAAPEATQENAQAEATAVARPKKRRGRPALVNISLLDANYAAGDTVTLSRLQADGLVSRRAHSLKVLADGSLSKPLTVEANKYSLTAVKMILLTGGTPVQID